MVPPVNSSRPNRLSLLIALAAIALLFAGCSGLTPETVSPSVARIYWTDAGRNTIGRAGLDGSGVEDLLPHGLVEPYGIALAVADGKMYWADWDVGIQRANLDGTGVEPLVGMGLADPRGIALDIAGGSIYAIDHYPTESRPNEIRRFNLDGTGGEDLGVDDMSGAYDIALDVADGKMYWTDRRTDRIQRANFDGSGVQDVVTTGLMDPWGIALYRP